MKNPHALTYTALIIGNTDSSPAGQSLSRPTAAFRQHINLQYRFRLLRIAINMIRPGCRRSIRSERFAMNDIPVSALWAV